MNQDQDQLKLLSIFHFIVAGIVALFSFLPVIHLVIGLGMITGTFPVDKPQDAVAGALGWFFVVAASLAILCGLTFAACLVLAGRNLVRHRRYTFCLVIAALACTFMPFGTALGVFTIIVLLRPSVKELFGQPTPAPATERPE